MLRNEEAKQFRRAIIQFWGLNRFERGGGAQNKELINFLHGFQHILELILSLRAVARQAL